MGKVFKDKPITEITLRKFERPAGENMRELVRKFCISLGLLQPGDSRDVIVDILNILINAKKERKILSSVQIEKEVKAVRTKGVASSNIRRQILRLERIGILEKYDKGYRLKEFLSLTEILEGIKKFIVEPTFDRIKEYASKIDR